MLPPSPTPAPCSASTFGAPFSYTLSGLLEDLPLPLPLPLLPFLHIPHGAANLNHSTFAAQPPASPRSALITYTPTLSMPYHDAALLLLSTALFLRAVEPPFVAPRAARLRGDSIARAGLTRVHRYAQCGMVLAACWNAWAVLHYGWGDAAASASPSATATLTPTRCAFYAGNALLLLGSVGRLACHRELGRWFTFDLACQRAAGQRVVSTGPYAVVRHPAYTFTVALVSGVFLAHLVGCVGWPRWVRVLGLVVELGRHGKEVQMLERRMGEEEGMLRREMGDEYEAYMRRVRYKLVPGIY